MTPGLNGGPEVEQDEAIDLDEVAAAEARGEWAGDGQENEEKEGEEENDQDEELEAGTQFQPWDPARAVWARLREVNGVPRKADE